MQKRDHLDFWYAVNNTEIIKIPERHLETFGTTTLNYHLVSELMDVTNQIRVRQGRMVAAQPQIITPQAYAETLMEGFGEAAGNYIEWLRQHEQESNLHILQYGYSLKQESFNEYIVSGDIKTISERVKKELDEKSDPLSAMVIGVDDPWDVCLVKLFWEIIKASAATNVKDMHSKHLFDTPEMAKKRLIDELEKDFLAASKDKSLINALGEKLQKNNLFEYFEDRFFSLVKASKQK